MAPKKAIKKSPKARPAKSTKVLKTKLAPGMLANHNEVMLG